MVNRAIATPSNVRNKLHSCCTSFVRRLYQTLPSLVQGSGTPDYHFATRSVTMAGHFIKRSL